MYTLTGVQNKEERNLILDFTDFVLSRFVSTETLLKSRIRIKIVDRTTLAPAEAEELREASAWMTDDGRVNSKRQFTILIDKACVNRRAMKLVKKFKLPMQYLAHELIHVKQYLNGEMKDLSLTRVQYKGRIHKIPKDPQMDWSYYDSPWEVEAYGRMEACYAMYLVKLKNDAK